MTALDRTPSTERRPTRRQLRNAARLIEAQEAPHPADPGAKYRDRPIPRALGWATPGGGRSPNVEGARLYQATTSQVCGLFPFAVSSGAAPLGVPIGRHMHTAEPVGLDPSEWLRSGLVTNTGIWCQGQPGIGKSTIVKRLGVGLTGFGFSMTVPGDIKGEYSPLVEALGGPVWRIGRGLHSLNPLDAGPLGSALARVSGEERQRLLETIRARRLSLLEALVTIVRRGDVTVTERRLLGVALDLVVDAETITGEPTIPDVLRVLVNPPETLLSVGACDTPAEFKKFALALINTLGLLCEGAIRGMFDRRSTVTADLDAPAMSLDISALDDDDDDVVAAAMLCSWAWTASIIDASAAAGRRRNVFQVQDELWRALRVAPGLVERSDRVTRLNRHRGVVSVQVTHSLDDLEALPTEQDRAKARGMAQRNGIMVLGGMADKELDAVRRVTPLTSQERAMIRSWAAPPTWVAGTAHPGRGKYMIKSGERMGIPTSLHLVESERRLYNTDTAWEVNR
jgi:hypothetical protein